MTQKGKEENFLNVGLVCDGWNKMIDEVAEKSPQQQLKVTWQWVQS
jgi:hypothetical protein